MPANDEAIYDILTNISEDFLKLRDAMYPPAPTAPMPLGINLAGIADYSSEIPFIDVFSTSRRWTSQQAGKDYNGGPTLVLDTAGYPTSLAGPDCFAEALLFVDIDGHAPGGNYKLQFEGTGAIQFNGMATGTYYASGASVPINPQAGTFLALRIIKTAPDNYVRNISLINTDSYKLANSMFAPNFLQRTRQWNVVRFMDWTGTNNNPSGNWADRPKTTDASYGWGSGVSWEIVIQAIKNLNCDPWLCIPHTATDDYVQRLAALLASELSGDPYRTIYFEFSNECWNTVMSQNRWCKDLGIAAGLALDPLEAAVRYYAARACKVFKIIATAFSPFKNQIKFVLSTNHRDTRTAKWALDAADLGMVHALAVAPYWGHGDRLGNLPTMSVADILNVAAKDISNNTAITAENKDIADAHELELYAYEGGQHMVSPPGWNGDKTVLQKLVDANRDPGMVDLYFKDLLNWRTIAGGKGVFCLFSSVSKYTASGGLPTPYGCWGMLEYDDSTDSPKMQGVKKFLDSFK